MSKENAYLGQKIDSDSLQSNTKSPLSQFYLFTYIEHNPNSSQHTHESKNYSEKTQIYDKKNNQQQQKYENMPNKSNMLLFYKSSQVQQYNNYSQAQPMCNNEKTKKIDKFIKQTILLNSSIDQGRFSIALRQKQKREGKIHFQDNRQIAQKIIQNEFIFQDMDFYKLPQQIRIFVRKGFQKLNQTYGFLPFNFRIKYFVFDRGQVKCFSINLNLILTSVFSALFSNKPQQDNSKKIINNNRQEQLKIKYKPYILEVRQRCRYYLQIIRNISFPDSALLLATHNATRYIIICYISLLFQIQKFNFNFEIINKKQKELKKQNIAYINSIQFQTFMESDPFQDIAEVIKKIQNFFTKALEKIRNYENSQRDMIQNFKVVTVKAKQYVDYIKSLQKLKGENICKFKKQKQKMIKFISKFLQQQLFHRRTLKFKQLQMKYEFRDQIDKKKRHQLMKFVMETILLNYSILEMLNLTETFTEYQLKQLCDFYNTDNFLQISFNSTRYFSRYEIKDFQVIKNKFQDIPYRSQENSILIQTIVKKLVNKAQNFYENSWMKFKLPQLKFLNRQQIFFGPQVVSALKNIASQAITSQYIKHKQDWRQILYLRKKIIQPIQSISDNYKQLGQNIQKQLKIEQSLSTNYSVISTKSALSEGQKTILMQTIVRKTLRNLNVILKRLSSTFIAAHNSVRYMIIFNVCSFCLLAYKELKIKPNKWFLGKIESIEKYSIKAKSKLENYSKKYQKFKEIEQKSSQSPKRNFSKYKMESQIQKYSLIKQQAQMNQHSNQDQNKDKNIIQLRRMKQHEGNYKIVKKQQVEQMKNITIVWKVLSQKNSQSSTPQKCNKLGVETLSSINYLLSKYIFSEKAFNQKEIQVRYSITKKTQKAEGLEGFNQKSERMSELTNYLLELLLLNYSTVQMIQTFEISQLYTYRSRSIGTKSEMISQKDDKIFQRYFKSLENLSEFVYKYLKSLNQNKNKQRATQPISQENQPKSLKEVFNRCEEHEKIQKLFIQTVQQNKQLSQLFKQIPADLNFFQKIETVQGKNGKKGFSLPLGKQFFSRLTYSVQHQQLQFSQWEQIVRYQNNKLDEPSYMEVVK